MLARAGAHARTTADADTTWRTDATQLRATPDQAARTDLGDHFHFLIGSPTGLGGEGPEGGLRFPIQSRLAGPLFEPIRLDINLSPDDPRPVETLHLRNRFAFAGMPTVIVPAISAAQQLAEKLHAYTRDYGASENTRAKDLYDMLIIASDLPVSLLADLAEVCATTFTFRDTSWPPPLIPPPDSWSRPWAGFVRDYGTAFTDLTDAYTARAAFWNPLFTTVGSFPYWDSSTWTWAHET